MLAVLLIVVAVVAVVAIGLLFVGDAVGKTNSSPPQTVVDVHEAINFVAEAIPVSVSSVLSYDDVRRILRLHLEWLQAYHWAPEGTDEGPIVFEEFDALGYVMERADITGLDVEPGHVAAVIEAHTAYLQVMGAIHLEAPEVVEQDLASFPMLDQPRERPGLRASDRSDTADDGGSSEPSD
ncbi:MAG: hypothetical protein ACRBI6_19705 [Acidimicrobiales bacterium]